MQSFSTIESSKCGKSFDSWSCSLPWSQISLFSLRYSCVLMAVWVCLVGLVVHSSLMAHHYTVEYLPLLFTLEARVWVWCLATNIFWAWLPVSFVSVHRFCPGFYSLPCVCIGEGEGGWSHSADSAMYDYSMFSCASPTPMLCMCMTEWVSLPVENTSFGNLIKLLWINICGTALLSNCTCK